jgi:hypothetical protein
MLTEFARAAQLARNVTAVTEVNEFSRAMEDDPRGQGGSANGQEGRAGSGVTLIRRARRNHYRRFHEHP